MLLEPFKVEKSKFISNDLFDFCQNNYKYYYTIQIDSLTFLSIAIRETSYLLNALKNNTTIPVPINTHEYIRIIKTMRNKFNSNKSIYIHIIPSPFKKTWNNLSELGIENVNSGYTEYSSNYNNTIFIYRKEESFKVLIHELIHALELDCHNTNSVTNDYTEAIVETYATLINIIRKLTYKNKKTRTKTHNNMFLIPNNSQGFYYLFSKKVFKDELNYSLQQAKRLLRAHDCQKNQCKKKFTSITPVFSYYILKASFLNSPKEFLNDFSFNKIKDCNNLSINFSLFLGDKFEKSLEKVSILKSDSMRMTLND
jgi:hypothetical protein